MICYTISFQKVEKSIEIKKLKLLGYMWHNVEKEVRKLTGHVMWKPLPTNSSSLVLSC